MQASALALLVAASTLTQYGPPVRYYGHGPIQKDEMQQQQQAFKQWWGDDLMLKLSDLPPEGKVPDYRLPYSGHDYPDRAGGTIAALSKYDRAFHSGRPLATEFEHIDVSAHRASGRGRGDRDDLPPRMGLFGRIRAGRGGVPGWYGHCNGWTAAAIRHAEPQTSVVRNGVTFTPADIKGLLAEMYMYTETEFLGGVDPAINPGTLHLTLGNWLGRGSHPVGMETAVGEVVINYPIFSYKMKLNKLSDRQTEVQNTITYAVNINREMDKAPANYNKQLYFHYVLDLNESGEIRGGRYYGDSNQIDMLWTPLQPAQGGHEKNKRGNPHLNIKEVLAIWRESVPEDLRKKWLNVDPTEEDRILPPVENIAASDPPKSPVATDSVPSAATAAASTDVTVSATTAETGPTTTTDGDRAGSTP